MYTFDPERLAKVEQLRASGTAPWPTGGAPTLSCAAAHERPEPDGEVHRVAGRLMFKNEMGKAGFARILDRTGRLQVYVKRDLVGDEAFALWKRLDLGDIVGATGTLMRTRTGELTLQATALTLLSKCINSLPDKWHGMTDPEERRRQRYVDLFATEDTRRNFVERSRIVRQIRAFFEERDFLEVETPMMHAIPGGANARPFVTHHNALDMPLYLRVAPELYLKRLIVGGLERVYEINRNFRNEGLDATHNPEFTMLEFYQAYATWEDLVAMTEELVAGLAPSGKLVFQGQEISLARPFRRARYGDLLAEATGLSPATLSDVPALRAAMGPDAPATLGACWDELFDRHVQKMLVDPTFVTHFPVEISPLARRNDADPTLADRFELFIAAREIANGFNELNDPVDQAERFATQARGKAAGDEEAMHFDADYVHALTFGMPPTAGEGIGIDRLVMLLTDTPSIRDVILFPTLRPRG
jgi:lysyl-tRNA synthetase class 2